MPQQQEIQQHYATTAMCYSRRSYSSTELQQQNTTTLGYSSTVLQTQELQQHWATAAEATVAEATAALGYRNTVQKLQQQELQEHCYSNTVLQ